MKLHFSIPAAEELREGRGGHYVLYSLFLEGFLLGKARYRQLRRWDEQLRQVFGSAVPAFPPKFYLAMTKSMADERRSQLEQYLQNVTLDANITKSDVFINFFRKLQLALLVRGGDPRSGRVQDLFDLQLCACLSRQVMIVLPKAVSYLADFKATFKIQTQRAFLDVYLADGSNITLDIQTSDTAERILQDLKQNKTIVCPNLNQLLLCSPPPDFSVPIIPSCSWFCRSLLGFFIGATSVLFQNKMWRGHIKLCSYYMSKYQVMSCKMGLARELIKYFTFFFIQDRDDGALSVVKKVAEFELPYVSLQGMQELDCKLGIRKWYMDPSLDTLLTDCKASMNLLYMQAIQEVKRNWVKPTEGQMQELEFLQKNANKAKFLEKIREVQFYGYVRLDPCICDYPEVGCSAEIYAGNNEINCCIKLPTNQTKEGEEDILEFRFEYNDSGTWEWIILYTKQAFLLSSCLKKMILEQMIKETNKVPEMETEMLESMKTSKKSSIQQKQVVHSSFISRKRFLVRPNEEDCVFEKIREEDL